MKRSFVRTLSLGAALAALCGWQGLCAMPEDDSASPLHGDILAAVMALHQLDEDGAIERMAKEADATEIYRNVRDLGIPSYAGGWLDPVRLTLQVAISDPANTRLVKLAGAEPVLVSYSLYELQAVLKEVTAHIERELDSQQVIRKTYVDVRSNRVVIGVEPTYTKNVQATARAAIRDPDLVSVIEVTEEIRPSSGPVRGADGTRNYTGSSKIQVIPVSLFLALSAPRWWAAMPPRDIADWQAMKSEPLPANL